ncbi:MAG: Holliday junction resolvase RuvX [Bacillota bacterium]
MEYSTSARVLGLDVGEKTIGLAVSDGLGLTAQPLDVLRRTNLEADLEQLMERVRELGVNAFVVGLPRNMNGTLGPAAESCRRFAEALGDTSGLPVHMVDERLTTVAAHRTLLEADLSRARRRQVVDATAAALILQTYLDRRARTSGGVE